ncbi:hypothetical protein IMG5_172560 [Ichthyophthirius multifiliis]|uniref:RCK N-terminal domain-containing protein n=1 Tax=Ichthyophthirius multifiliis TaxID=5932 RepID=G0R1T0_ICHMU|nr:hypothetical protein IMG5_172560 [Ichthyophthirius multifiliis]EGR28582.1 hypothetical protein IMG5_172560 [Ichthyophthirius multifiliis]|eukprot:XP_004029818.1 hypothetical protein IMG5_172560 [Ichthyophthirius multifiliis]
MIYFVVVTTATVGYGDITPKSEEGRIIVIIMIVILIVLIPKQTNELINLMQMQSKYARFKYQSNPDTPHILVCGHIEVSALKFFCKELFHPDHGGQDKHAIILQHKPPSQEMEKYLHNPQYEVFLHYIQGNPMLERDLKRTSVHTSKACVLLTDKYITDSHSADHKNVLTALAIKKFVHHSTNGDNNIRLCIQLIKPESKTHYYSALQNKSNDLLIVVEEFKMNLVHIFLKIYLQINIQLAKSCFCPGIISLLGNLISSAGEIDDQYIEEEWLKEYMRGMGHEIYRTDLSFKAFFFLKKNIKNIKKKKFEGKTFTEIAATIYTEYNGILFGIELDVGGQTIIRLNPGHYVIPNTLENNVKQLFDEDIDSTESDYVLLQDSVQLINVTLISIKDSTKVTNHIVLCGIHPSIYYFILPLRAKYLKEYQYIVILSEEQPTKIWNDINRFPKIIFIKGSPLKHEDLMRANINFADKAVIFSKEVNKLNKEIDEMIDSESIFIFKAIQKINQNVQIMIEMVYASNAIFVQKKSLINHSNSQLKTELIPLYAAGQIYVSPIIDTLTCQTYYNPHILTILQQILTGDKSSSAVIRAICDHADLHQSNLWQIPVPEDYFNKTFGQLFHYLATEKCLVAIGLYRLAGSLDNSFAYTYTNPKENVYFIKKQCIKIKKIRQKLHIGIKYLFQDIQYLKNYVFFIFDKSYIIKNIKSKCRLKLRQQYRLRQQNKKYLRKFQ